jgi:hypothetical protein
VSVTSSADSTAAATTPGTLRYALTNAQDGDVISIASGLTIQLTDALPQITKSITIEGNGLTLTRAASWTSTGDTSQLLLINSNTAVVNISRVWFKDGRATDRGAAIYIIYGTLTLESCIFSGNQTPDTYASGGAICKTNGTLTVKGCTFYQNSARSGGAIMNFGGTLTLTGNLFYGNAPNNSVVYSNQMAASGGHNVVDFPINRWSPATGDTNLATLLGDNTTSPFVNVTDFTPKTDLYIVPSGVAGFPTTDFNGNTRNWSSGNEAPGAVK